MKHSILFFLKTFGFWLVFFLFFKIFFLWYNYLIIADLPSTDIIGIFTHGIIMDLSVAGYLSFIPGLIISVGFVFFPKTAHSILQYYTLLLLVLLVIMGLGDAGLFADWGSRLNAQILLYLQNPGGMYAALNWLQIITLFACWIGFTWSWYYLYKKLFKSKQTGTSPAKWTSIPVIILLTAVLIIPIRGGLNTSPLNHSNVYFSENLQANQSAYNYFWNFIFSVDQAKYNKTPVHYMSTEASEEIVENSYNTHDKYPVYIQQNGKGPINVVLILLESFSNKLIAPAGGLPNATPRLNQLCREGILFTNFFATGNRSDMGMCAVLGGYPSVINRATVLAFPEKMNRLYYFPKQFKKHGYDLSFYYGGDVNFYNTRSALIQSGFNHIVSNTDFPNQVATIQRWGVPDQQLYERFFADLQQKKQPFFSMVYTISSHEPFDVPYHQITGDDKSAKYLNSIAYSDHCLGAFIDKLKASPLWKNTLVVITSDHCSLLPEPATSIEDPNSYRVPLLWTGGAIDTSFVCAKIAMHNDLGPTLIQQMGWKDKRPKFSKNIFSSTNYAFYFRDAGWGFVSPSLTVFQNIQSKKLHIFKQNEKQHTDSLINFAKAYVQYLHDDFSKN